MFGLRAGEPLDESSYSWLVNPSYQLTDDVLLYASAAPARNRAPCSSTGQRLAANVEPERSLNFEVGVKS